MLPCILSLLLSLAPHAPRRRLLETAAAIESAALTPEETAALVTISFYETTFGRAGIPFGISCCWRPGLPTAHWAGVAREVYRRAAEVCGTASPRAVRLGYFHTGRCRADEYSQRQARTMRRLLARGLQCPGDASSRTALSARRSDAGG